MDIQRERDLYLAELLEREVITQDEFRDLVFKPEINAFDSNYLSSRFIDNINWGWNSWQAAKAQAVPEGYVLVPKEPTPKMIDSTWDYFEDIEGMSHNKRNEFIYKAMIDEAQEPTND